MAFENTYGSQTVTVCTQTVGKRWNWSYTIDGGHYTENREELAPTEGIAVQEAFAHAERRIRAGL